MSKEKWKEIPIAPNFYASDLGRIKGPGIDGPIIEGTPMGGKPGNRYVMVSLRGCGQFKRARLIALTFIPNPENKPEVDHINTVRYDDRVENLRWVTHKENMNNSLTLQHMSERLFTEEYRRHISEAKKGKPRSEECRRHISEAKKGKQFTEEHRKHISEAQKGKPRSEETRKRISEAQKGKPRSEETRKRISEAMKRRHKKLTEMNT